MDDETFTVDEAIALHDELVRTGESRRIRLRPEPRGKSLGLDPDIQHLDGVAWHDAPIPRRQHRCWVQTSGWIGLSQYCRCACGAVCNSPEKGYPAATWHWMNRNSR